MQFWQLTHPDYTSDYQNTYINGMLEHPFGLPGVHCDVCNATWSGSRVLPIQCPEVLRNQKHLQERWPLPLVQHQSLQEVVKDEFSHQGISISKLKPGDDFQPCYLDIPSRPRADFLWCNLGSVVVSDRVRRLFESLQIAGVTFCPVIFRKVGRREANLPAPIPSSGEPEDILKNIPKQSDGEINGSYFELLIQTESARPPGGEPLSVCSRCGREAIDNNQRRLIMDQTMWLGSPIFYLSTTLHILITDELKHILEKHECTNIALKAFPAI